MLNKIKSLATETSVYGIFTVVNRLMTFILTPIYSNYLSISQFDFLIYLFSFSTFLSVLYSFGMEGAFLRFFDHDSEEKSKEAFSFAYISVNIIAFLFTVFIIIYSEPLAIISGYTSIPEAGNLIILAALIPFLDVLSYIPFNYLRVTNRALKLSSIKFLVIVISLILHFLLLSKYDFQAQGALIAQIIANFAAFVALISIILQNLTFKIDKSLISKMFKFALPTIPAGLAAIFLQVADRPMLKYLTNSELDITTYQVNYRLGIPMLIFVSVFDYAWQPFYLKYFKDKDADKLFGRVMTYYTLIAGFAFLGITFFMENFVKIPFPGGTLINSNYWSGLNILPLIVIAYYFYGLYVNFSIGVIISNKSYATSIALGAGVIVNVLANFILVPYFGFVGSAYSIILAYFTAMLIIFIFSRGYFKVNYEWLRVTKVIISVAILYFAVTTINHLLNNEIAELSVKIAGVIFYIILLKLFGFFTDKENEFIKNFFLRKDSTK